MSMRTAVRAWYDGQIPAEFLDVYREKEYIRTKTKGMSPEETRRFAMAYYGWGDDDPDSNASDEAYVDFITEMNLIDPDEDFPFH